MDDFIIVEWGGGKRKLYKAICATCGCDRGYKRLDKVLGNCKSCQKKIDCGTLNIIKKCIACGTTHVKDPNKHWHKGPICNRCYGKIYRQENKEQIRARIYNWRANNPEQHKVSERVWREENKEHKDAMDRQWRIDNIEHVRQSSRERQKRKERENPSYRIARRMRARFYKSMKFGDLESFSILSKYITYSFDEAKQYIESLFLPEMNWENYGVNGWHVDHIKPLCSFDLTKESEIIEAWQLSNLRPLWCDKNWKKSKLDKLCKIQK